MICILHLQLMYKKPNKSVNKLRKGLDFNLLDFITRHYKISVNCRNNEAKGNFKFYEIITVQLVIQIYKHKQKATA